MTAPRKAFAKVEETGFHAMLKRVVAEELAQIEADYRARDLSAYADLCRRELDSRSAYTLVTTQGWTPCAP
jgi:hypothetical protein